MNLSLYPIDWPEISIFIKEANGYVCQGCRKQCRRPGEMFLGWQYELSVAHLTQNYEADWVQLAPLCVVCHLRFDAPHAWIARHRRKRLRRAAAGQLAIF